MENTKSDFSETVNWKAGQSIWRRLPDAFISHFNSFLHLLMMHLPVRGCPADITAPRRGQFSSFWLWAASSCGAVIVSKFQRNYDQTSKRITGLHPDGSSEVRGRQKGAVTLEGKKVCSQLEHSTHNFWQVISFVLFCAVAKLHDFCLPSVFKKNDFRLCLV